MRTQHSLSFLIRHEHSLYNSNTMTAGLLQSLYFSHAHPLFSTFLSVSCFLSLSHAKLPIILICTPPGSALLFSPSSQVDTCALQYKIGCYLVTVFRSTVKSSSSGGSSEFTGTWSHRCRSLSVSWSRKCFLKKPDGTCYTLPTRLRACTAAMFAGVNPHQKTAQESGCSSCCLFRWRYYSNTWADSCWLDPHEV